MPKEYVHDISDPEFANKLINGIESQIVDLVKENPNQCTNCSETVYLNPGKNICPFCKEELNLIVSIAHQTTPNH